MNARRNRPLLQTFLPKLLTLASFLSLPVLTLAAPGDLDPTFGNGGIVISTGGSINTLESVLGLALQADGKIVAAGYGAAGGSSWDFAVARYNTDGSLDTSFGSNGVVGTPLSTDPDFSYSVRIQADGKIVAAGGRFIVRYNPNGSLDTSFDNDGIVTTFFSDGYAAISAAAIQADGKILVAGTSSGNRFAVVRYNTNGSPDTSFDNDGIVTTGVGTAFAVAIQADGKIVAAGTGVVRCNADGSLDTTFNGTGIITTPGSLANSVAIQADGKILTANGFNGFPSENRLVRYNANGTPDTSFNGTGSVAIPIFVSSAAIQANGKIVAAGYTEFGEGLAFAVIRLNGNASLDATFGGTGTVITPIVDQYYYSSGAYAVAIQPDGNIVAAGGALVRGFDFFDFALVRYQGGSGRTRFDFDGDDRADISVFRSTDRVWYLNRSTQGFAATQFGLSTDRITATDYDGDGKTDISVYRAGTWYWLTSSNNSFNAAQFGLADDIPVPTDFTGDGRAELAVYRHGAWWTLDLANNQASTIQFGLASDKPLPADYDGDGRADQAVYRNGEWHLNRSTQGYEVVHWGLATDKPVPADYDGDGKTDPAVYRDGTWYLLQSLQGWGEFPWGNSSDIPAPADYDGDGKTDAAVFRDGVWYLRRTASGISIQHFGQQGDKPVPATFLP